nr:D-alanyl-D-alanine carboxypeptidase family protein [Amycolatopsis albispora]
MAARLLAVALLPLAFVLAPRRARHVACQWALAARFPAENLAGLTLATRRAFTAARTQAFWHDGTLIGLTSGYRNPAEQRCLYAEELRRIELATTDARPRVLPAEESRHVVGTALDVRPAEGARWLERHGAAYDLYRVYDNEWWHFEHRPDGPPVRLRYPGASLGKTAVLPRPALDSA